MTLFCFSSKTLSLKGNSCFFYQSMPNAMSSLIGNHVNLSIKFDTQQSLINKTTFPFRKIGQFFLKCNLSKCETNVFRQQCTSVSATRLNVRYSNLVEDDILKQLIRKYQSKWFWNEILIFIEEISGTISGEILFTGFF